jgi:hypothetical protein
MWGSHVMKGISVRDVSNSYSAKGSTSQGSSFNWISAGAKIWSCHHVYSMLALAFPKLERSLVIFGFDKK